MLQIRDIETFYGASQVLFGVGLEIGAGEVVTLMGRNGMGKTTTVRSIMGLTAPRHGSVQFGGVELAGRPAYAVARAGIGLVPEGRQIFPNLTVRENMVATAAGEAPWTYRSVCQMFPRLAERAGNMGDTLSGGEQQMLAIARALMTNPKLLILDEATEGLAPLVRQEIWTVLAQLKQAGQAILVIDKDIAALARIADRHYILEKGRVVWSGGSSELASKPELAHRYLGV
jgi:branched-chain amino acid transport system ATP-binding protein